jgi:hypothetical protein
MFIHDNGNCAVLANLRCGSTNMFNYFNLEANNFGLQGWLDHRNPIVVLRNPIDRVVSSMAFFWPNLGFPDFRLAEFARHSAPYLHNLTISNFRIIDFNILEQYIPRKDTVQQQSVRTDTRCHPFTAAEDVYVPNPLYTLEDLQKCVETYKDFIANKERVTVDEWKTLTIEK